MGGHAGGGVQSGRRFPVLGVQSATRLLRLDIGEGRDLQPDEADTLVANTALVERYPQIRVGETLVLRMGPAESRWRVVGIAREAFSPPVAYVPRAYPHRVTLFKATRLGGRFGKDPTMGWGLLAAGGVEMHELPGEHLTVLRQPHVNALAAALERSLRDAMLRASRGGARAR